MNNEEIRNIIKWLSYSGYTPLDVKNNAIELIKQLQHENKELKEQNATLMTCLTSSRRKYNNDKARYRRKAKGYRTILKQLESWLKEELKEEMMMEKHETLYEVLDKLKELRGSDET